MQLQPVGGFPSLVGQTQAEYLRDFQGDCCSDCPTLLGLCHLNGSVPSAFELEENRRISLVEVR